MVPPVPGFSSSPEMTSRPRTLSSTMPSASFAAVPAAETLTKPASTVESRMSSAVASVVEIHDEPAPTFTFACWMESPGARAVICSGTANSTRPVLPPMVTAGCVASAILMVERPRKTTAPRVRPRTSMALPKSPVTLKPSKVTSAVPPQTAMPFPCAVASSAPPAMVTG